VTLIMPGEEVTPGVHFSAEASFAVGTSLGVTGIATLRGAGAKPLPWLAVVPGLFAVQPCAEGVVWRYLNGGSHHPPYSNLRADAT